MVHTHRPIAVVIGAFLLVGGGQGLMGQSAAVEIASGTTFPLAAGNMLELRAVNGEASFLKAPGDQAIVEFARAVPGDVKVFVVKTAQGLTVCAVYTSTDPKKPTECLAAGRGRLTAGKAKDQSRVQFRIRVPAGVHINASIDEGDLKSSEITGNLQFYSTKGNLLMYDGGGPGTITAGVGLLGSIDAVISKAQNGPSRRQVELKSPGSGRVRVVLPRTVAVSYRISSQRPAAIDPVFGVKKVDPPILLGSLGPVGESLVRLDVDTGIAGQFVLLPAK